MSNLFGEPWCSIRIDETAAHKRNAAIVSWFPFHIEVSIGHSWLAGLQLPADRNRLIQCLVSRTVARLRPEVRKRRRRIDNMLTAMFASSTFLWLVSMPWGVVVDVILLAALYASHKVFTVNEQFIREISSNRFAIGTPHSRQEGNQ